MRRDDTAFSQRNLDVALYFTPEAARHQPSFNHLGRSNAASAEKDPELPAGLAGSSSSTVLQHKLSWLGRICGEVFRQPVRPTSVYVAPVNRVRG